MPRLRLAEVERIRSTPGKSLLLFLTDRCPVGCGHCSVDSRADSPTIRDYALFESILAAVCAERDLTTVGISGGEPFVERRGLTLAVDRLVAAGKHVVLYTSGVWANPRVPDWIPAVIRRASCVFLSTDAFHAEQIDDARFVRASRTIAAEGVWMIVQVIRRPEMVRKAEALLEAAFGDAAAEYAELNRTPALPYGRGARVFAGAALRPGESFGACALLGSPVVRYDGVTTACCNERLILERGPAGLRRRVSSGKEVVQALADFRADSLLKVIGGAGAGALTLHPRFADLARREFSNICDLCWAMHERAPELAGEPDRLLEAMAVLGPAGVGAAP